MGSDTFFYGLRVGETSDIKIAEGKILTVKLIEVKELDEEGFREVVFEVNGNRRTVSIKDQGAKAQAAAASVVMADPDNEKEIGANTVSYTHLYQISVSAENRKGSVTKEPAAANGD